MKQNSSMLFIKRHLLKRKSANGNLKQSSSVGKEKCMQKQSSSNGVSKQNLSQCSSTIFVENSTQYPSVKEFLIQNPSISIFNKKLSVGIFEKTSTQNPSAGIFNKRLSVGIFKETSIQNPRVGISNKHLTQRQNSSGAVLKQKCSHSSKDGVSKTNLKQSSSAVIFKQNSTQSHSSSRYNFHAFLPESRVEIFKQKPQRQSSSVSILKQNVPENQSSSVGNFGQNWIHAHQVVRNFETGCKEGLFTKNNSLNHKNNFDSNKKDASKNENQQSFNKQLKYCSSYQKHQHSLSRDSSNHKYNFESNKKDTSKNENQLPSNKQSKYCSSNQKHQHSLSRDCSSIHNKNQESKTLSSIQNHQHPQSKDCSLYSLIHIQNLQSKESFSSQLFIENPTNNGYDNKNPQFKDSSLNHEHLQLEGSSLNSIENNQNSKIKGSFSSHNRDLDFKSSSLCQQFKDSSSNSSKYNQNSEIKGSFSGPNRNIDFKFSSLCQQFKDSSLNSENNRNLQILDCSLNITFQNFQSEDIHSKNLRSITSSSSKQLQNLQSNVSSSINVKNIQSNDFDLINFEHFQLLKATSSMLVKDIQSKTKHNLLLQSRAFSSLSKQIQHQQSKTSSSNKIQEQQAFSLNQTLNSLSSCSFFAKQVQHLQRRAFSSSHSSSKHIENQQSSSLNLTQNLLSSSSSFAKQVQHLQRKAFSSWHSSSKQIKNQQSSSLNQTQNLLSSSSFAKQVQHLQRRAFYSSHSSSKQIENQQSSSLNQTQNSPSSCSSFAKQVQHLQRKAFSSLHSLLKQIENQQSSFNQTQNLLSSCSSFAKQVQHLQRKAFSSSHSSSKQIENQQSSSLNQTENSSPSKQQHLQLKPHSSSNQEPSALDQGPNSHCLHFEDIPSPKGLPIFGTTLSLILSGGASKLHAYADKRHRSLGPIFKESLGNIQAVFISNPDYMRAVFAQEGKYPVHVLPEAWILYNKLYGCSRGLFFMDGEEWLKNRRIMNKFLLKGSLDYGWIKRACEISSRDLIGELKKMSVVLEGDHSSRLKESKTESKTDLEGRNACADLKEPKVLKKDFVFDSAHFQETQASLGACKANPKNSHKAKEDSVVCKPLTDLENENLESKLYRWSLDTIIAILIGDQTYLKNKDSLQPKLKDISKKINLIFETSAKLQFIPAALAAKFEIKAWRNFKESVDEALSETNDLVRELLKDYPKNEGLLGMMVEEEMDEEDVVKIVVDLVLAAGDTTAYTMEWVLYLLAKNQEQQEFLYQEMFGNNTEGLLGVKNIKISKDDQQEGGKEMLDQEIVRNNIEEFSSKGVAKILNQNQQEGLDKRNVKNQQKNIDHEILKNQQEYEGKEIFDQEIMRNNIKEFSSEEVTNILNQKQHKRNVRNQQENIGEEISKNQREYEEEEMLDQEVMRNNTEEFSRQGIMKILNQKQHEGNVRNQQENIGEEISKNQQEYLGGEHLINSNLDENHESLLLKNFIKETLRLYPVAPFLTRILPEDSKVGPYLIPKNTLILYSLFTSGRDQAYFENPELFKPERWRSRSKNMAQSSLPFAMGSRSCVGRKIAEFQLQIALKNVLEEFKVEMKNSVNIDIVLKMVAVPDKPLELKLTKRER